MQCDPYLGWKQHFLIVTRFFSWPRSCYLKAPCPLTHSTIAFPFETFQAIRNHGDSKKDLISVAHSTINSCSRHFKQQRTTIIFVKNLQYMIQYNNVILFFYSFYFMKINTYCNLYRNLKCILLYTYITWYDIR